MKPINTKEKEKFSQTSGQKQNKTSYLSSKMDQMGMEPVMCNSKPEYGGHRLWKNKLEQGHALPKDLTC